MQEYTPFLDRTKKIEISVRDKLPHWHQDEKIQFVTFRLADSLPQAKIQEIKLLIEDFESRHPKPWDKTIKSEYQKLIGSRYEVYLDNGYGECLLKEKSCQEILRDTLIFYNNVKYNIIAFVIMPNHVHLLLRLIEDNKLDKIIQSIKRHSAREINRLMKRNGPVWMKRYFDRIVRSEDNLMHCINYIKDNPRHLAPGEYNLFVHLDY